MSRWKTALVVLLACGLVLTAGVHTQPVPVAAIRAAPEVVVPPTLEEREWPATLDTRSPEMLLQRACAQLAPGRLTWLETTIWQELRAGDLSYQAEGSYLLGPDARAHLRLLLRTGRMQQLWRIVSDGKRVQETIEVGGKIIHSQCTCLPEVPPASASAPSSARADVLQEKSIPSLHHLLSKVQQGLREPYCRAVLWGERPCVEITGRWVGSLANQQGAANLTPRLNISKCRLYLDADSLWPHRLEWWGQVHPQAPLTLILHTEYRQPHVNRPLSPERVARELTLPEVK